MIDLLARLRSAETGATAVLGPRAARLLEWERLAGQLARHCLSGRAGAALRGRRPGTDPGDMELRRALADELRPAAESRTWPPLINIDPLLDLLQQPPPVRMEGPDLVQVAAAAEALDELRNHYLAVRPSHPLWGEAAVQMATFDGLSGGIRRALDPDGRVQDAASPLLSRLRRSVGGRERAVRDAVHGAMADARRQGWTTGSEATLRGDRFCLPMRAGDSRKVQGIVHDRSQTGATLFVEPAAVVHLSNELVGMRLEIAQEEARILFELNRAVDRASDSLAEAADVMLALDEARAHLLWSHEVGGRRVTVATGAGLRVSGGRHPLLMAALGDGDPAAGRDAVVPLDLEIPAEARALVVSGPNAGGKSVALKTVGVLSLMAQCGWDVPAREDTRLPLVRRVLVDLGDDQSIAESLSSFSAHLGHLARFLAEAGPDTMVLCDEIGSGTDPQEGTALAFGVLERLVEKGAMVLASTHFGLLKAAVHDHPAMANAAMDYDEQDLRPLFTFRVGDPGTSHAFDIAARMGLPADLLRTARSRAGEERVQIEQLLADLDKRARELTEARDEARRREAELAVEQSEMARRLKGLDGEHRRTLAEVRRQGEEMVRAGRRAIENAVREIREQEGRQPVVRSARDRLAGLESSLPAVPDEALAPPGFRPEVGQRVRIPHLSLVGRVVEVRGDRLVADADGLRLTMPVDAVTPLEGEEPTPERATVHAAGWSLQGEEGGAVHEIDLRGERGEEGWERLDRFLDRAIPSGLETVLVIHGTGTGRLRDHLHGLLRRDPRVASFAEAGPGQGGGGATRVVLAAD